MVNLLTLLGIPTYIIVGIILILIGILLASFVPIIGKKIGAILVIIGIVMSVGFSYLSSLFQDTTFLIVTILFASLIFIIWILFPDSFKKQ